MEIEQTVRDMMPWLHRLAASFVRDYATAQDLAQEASVAVWKELVAAKESGREVNVSYLRKRGRWTMLNALRHRSDVPVTEAAFTELAVTDRDAGGAYHSREISDAIAGLSSRQREYIRLRFWEDLGTPGLVDRGYSRNLWYDSRHGARAKLRDKLGHLANA